jgi:hypothetical protein
MPDREKSMKHSRHFLYLAIFFTGALCVQCGKKTDFLYLESKLPPYINHAETRKVKEMEGNNLVDILWVIDNSLSMADEHANLIKNTNLFISQFVQKGNIDWKMGIISTDTSDLPYAGFLVGDELNSKIANPVAVFQRAVGKLGISGSGYEKAFEPIVNATQGYPSFVRPGAYFAIIFVTDEPEQSSLQTPQSMLKYLETLKGDLKLVLGYGVFSDYAMGCKGGFYYKGSKYETFLKGLKHKVFSLCSPNFGQNLTDLGADIVTFVQNRRFPLSVRPVPDSIKVLHKGQEIKGGLKEEGGHWLYDYDLNAITFTDLDFAPGTDEEIKILYDELRPK